MIYIDPPYNTGNNTFVYKDSFKSQKTISSDDIPIHSININNTSLSHSNWCSMMYSRLLLARNLLSEDGVIFMSIDDNEQENLKKICDEVFGAENFISNVIIQNNPRGRQSDKFFATVHEYLICYTKNIQACKINGSMLTDEQKKEYSFSDKNGNIDMHETFGGRPVKINLSAQDMKEVKKLFDKREERRAKNYAEMKKADKEYNEHRKMMSYMMNQ